MGLVLQREAIRAYHIFITLSTNRLGLIWAVRAGAPAGRAQVRHYAQQANSRGVPSSFQQRPSSP